MSNAASRTQNNVKAGIFVTLSILIGLCVIFILGDFVRYFGPSDSSYTVTYSVADGVGGLGSGSFVKVGGLVVGEVDSVEFDVREGEPLKRIKVGFSMPAEMSLRSDAEVSVGAGLISSDAWLAFTSLGSTGSVLEPGSTLTEFQAVANEIAHEGQSVGEVVDTALLALGQQPSVISGWMNWLRANAAGRIGSRPLVAYVAREVMEVQTPADMR